MAPGVVNVNGRTFCTLVAKELVLAQFGILRVEGPKSNTPPCGFLSGLAPPPPPLNNRKLLKFDNEKVPPPLTGTPVFTSGGNSKLSKFLRCLFVPPV